MLGICACDADDGPLPAPERPTEEPGGGAASHSQVVSSLVVTQAADSDGFAQSVARDEFGIASFEPSQTVRRQHSFPPRVVAPDQPPSSRQQSTHSTQAVLEHAAAINPSTVLRGNAVLADPGFDFSQFRRRTGASRDAVISQRKAGLRPGQDRLAAWLNERDGRVLARYWAANVIYFELPARHVPDLSRHPDVLAIEFEHRLIPGTPPFGWTGDELKAATRTYEMRAAGYWGHAGSISDGFEVRIAVGDSSPLASDHVGWLDWVGGPSRIHTYERCTGLGCTPNQTVAQDSTHGTVVSWIATGSIEQDQDPNYPYYLQTAQRQRSGIAQEAELIYLEIEPNGTFPAFARAIELEADVYVIPGHWACTPDDDPCDLACFSQTSWIAMLKNAADAGIIIPACAGNEYHSGGCSVQFPGFSSFTLGVNGLESGDAAYSYDDLWMLPSASRGGVPVEIYPYGGVRNVSGIDFVAPGRIARHFTDGPNYYAGPFIEDAGCSYATPVVAGVAAMFRHALWSIGFNSGNAFVVMANMLLLGDQWDADSGSKLSFGVSDISGFGRIKAHWPASSDLTAPWRWSARSFTIYDWGEVSWDVIPGGGAMPAQATMFRSVVTWMEEDGTDVADIVLEVHDTCAEGGGDYWVDWDWSWDWRKRVILSGAEMAGRCLQVKARAFGVPPEGRRVYAAEFYHSGSTTSF